MTTPPAPPDERDDRRANYEPQEERAIREQFRSGQSATCPRDGTVMTLRRIGGGSFGLGYARNRQWLLCPACKRSVIFDRERGTRT